MRTCAISWRRVAPNDSRTAFISIERFVPPRASSRFAMFARANRQHRHRRSVNDMKIGVLASFCAGLCPRRPSASESFFDSELSCERLER